MYLPQFNNKRNLIQSHFIISCFYLGGHPFSTNAQKIYYFNVSHPEFVFNQDIPQTIRIFAQSHVTVNDIIYILYDDQVSSNNTISTFNMSNQTFSTHYGGAILPFYVARYGALSHIDGYLCIVGGRYSHSDILSKHGKFQILRMNDHQWISGPDMPRPCDEHASYIHNNYLFVIGSHTDIVSKIYVGDMENIMNYSWTNLTDKLSPERRNDTYPRVVEYNHNLFVLGGDRNNTPIDVISTITDEIIQGVSYLYRNVQRGAAVVANEQMYMFGGYCVQCRYIVDTYQYAELLTLNPTTEPTFQPTNSLSVESMDISCINVEGDESGPTDFAESTATCSGSYTLVSCGYRTKSVVEDDIRGGGIDGQTCKAYNFAPSDGVYAIARCCDLSAYGVSCNTSQSNRSAAVDDAKSYEQCGANEQLTGCAAQGDYRINGVYPGHKHADPFYTDTIDYDVDTWYVIILFS